MGDKDGSVKLNITLDGVPQVVTGMREVENATDQVAVSTSKVTGRMSDASAAVGTMSQAVETSAGQMHNHSAASGRMAAGLAETVAHAHRAYMGMSEFEMGVMSATMRITNLTMAAALIAAPFIAGTAAIKKGLEVIDDFQVSTVQIAAQLTQLQGPKDVAKHFQESYRYAEALAGKLEEIDADSFANNKGLMGMLQTMTMQGVVLDINNKKQVESFTNLSNAIAMYTQGQDQAIQARQEMRALLTGEMNQNSQLSRILDSQIKQQGIYKGGLKEVLELGRQHGDTLERLSPYLVGIAAATGTINKTWSAVSSSIETAVNKITREGFATVFQDVVPLASQLVGWLKSSSAPSEIINKIWLATKGVIESVVGILRGPLWVILSGVGGLVAKFFDGWGMILSSVLPVLIDRFNHLLNLLNAMVNVGYAFGLVMLDTVGMVGEAIAKIGKAAWQALTGDFDGAQKTLQGIFTGIFSERLKGNLEVVKGAVIGIKEELAAMKDPFGEMGKRLDEYNRKMSQARGGSPAAPVIPPIPGTPETDEEAVKEQNKYADFYNKLQEQLIATTPLQEKFDQTLEKTRFEFAKMNDEVAPRYRATLKGLQEQIINNMEINQELARSSQAHQDSLRKEREEAEKLDQAYARMREHYKQGDELAGIQSETQNLNIGTIQDSADRETAQITKQYEDKLKAAQKYARDLKLIEQETGEDITKRLQANADLQVAIEKAKNDAIHRADTARMEANVSQIGDMVGQIGDIMQKGNKDQFEAGKAFALAAAGINIALAITKALAQGGIFGAAMAVGITALGALQLAAIASQEYVPRASYAVGSKDLPEDQVAQVHKGEMIIDAASAGVLRKYGINISSAAADNYETVSAMRDLRKSIENNSLAVARVADGLTRISGVLKDVSKLFTGIDGWDASKGTFGDKPAQDSYLDKVFTAAGNWFSAPGNLVGGAVKGMVGLFTLDVDKMFTGLKQVVNGMANMLTLGLAGNIFGGDKSVTSQGISLGYNGGLQARQYTNIKEDGGWFHSDSYSTVTSALPAETERAIADTVAKIRQTTLVAAQALGAGTDGILAAVLPLENLDLRGLDADAASRKVEEWLQKLGNTFANGVAGLEALRRPGEESFDALVRLAGALQGVNEQLELIGGRIINSTLANADAASRLADAFGGLDKMQSATDKYFEAMFTDGEQEALKAAQAQRQVNVAFSEMGVAVPPTREAFRSLVNSLDVSTQSGAALFKALMDIAPAFDTFVSQVEKTRGVLLDGWSDAELKQAQTMLDLAKQGAEFYRQSAQTIRDTLTALRGGDLSILSPEQKYLNARADFARTANLATAGDKDALSALPDLAQTFAAASRAYNASGPAYVADFNLITQALDATGLASANLANAADVQVDLLTTQVDILTALRDEMAKGVDANVTALQELATALSINSQSILDAGNLTSNSIAGNTGSVATMATATNAFTGQTATYQGSVNGVALALADTNSTWITANGNIVAVGTNTKSLLDATQAGVGSNGYVTAAITTTNQVSLPEVATKMVTATKALIDYYGAKARYDIAMQDLNTSANAAVGNADAALKFAAGLGTPTAADIALLDVAPLVNGVSKPDGKIDLSDAFVWRFKQVGGSLYNQQQAAIQAEYDAATSSIFDSFPAHATGGVASGWSIVGENGPELANFTSPARIYTADDTRAALGGSNKDMVALLKSIDAKLDRLEKLEQHAAASVWVQADALGRLVKTGEQQAKSLGGIESKARLEAAA